MRWRGAWLSRRERASGLISTSEEELVWLSGKPQAWHLRDPGYCKNKDSQTQRQERIGQFSLKDVLEKISPSRGVAALGVSQE